MRLTNILVLICLLATLAVSELRAQEEDSDPAEIAIGERLFLETRFAQAFKAFLDEGGAVNGAPESGDPALDELATTGAPLPNPFKGQTFNCRACHMVDESLDEPRGGMRTYNDFARRSPVPVREDGAATALRNSPPLVNASQNRPGGAFFHFDGEFDSMEDLVRGTISGRNFGWIHGEGHLVPAHVARIIREDEGLAADDFGGLSYAVTLTGTDPSIPAEFLLPEEFRVDVASASDQEIFDAVAKLIAAYTVDLAFSTDDAGDFSASPYDAFLAANDLPRHPVLGESPLAYSRRLLGLIRAAEADGDLQFIYSDPQSHLGAFAFHDQGFRFSHKELRGLKIFFSEPARGAASPVEASRGGVGACLRCHPAPLFTDFRFHNTGVAQREYDEIHGAGAFSALEVPGLETRNQRPDLYLPATEAMPSAAEPFRRIPLAERPGWTDLGAWNIFANPTAPHPQAKLWRAFCEPELLAARPELAGLSAVRLNLLLDDMTARGDRSVSPCTEAELLPKTVAAFKTAGLRDLSHSAPYMHNGAFDTLDQVLELYLDSAALARAGKLRNPPADLSAVAITKRDFADLVAFLQALSEDYN